jgi:hypothetical protein
VTRLSQIGIVKDTAKLGHDSARAEATEEQSQSQSRSQHRSASKVWGYVPGGRRTADGSGASASSSPVLFPAPSAVEPAAPGPMSVAEVRIYGGCGGDEGGG